MCANAPGPTWVPAAGLAARRFHRCACSMALVASSNGPGLGDDAPLALTSEIVSVSSSVAPRFAAATGVLLATAAQAAIGNAASPAASSRARTAAVVSPRAEGSPTSPPLPLPYPRISAAQLAGSATECRRTGKCGVADVQGSSVDVDTLLPPSRPLLSLSRSCGRIRGG
ncbi:hypothetical protein Vafri_13064 [Volvox africanus]|uniref:Uncharacterized protein n=1 Tax=Volvox africanus TaxID=51714 RepID=A0A8J4BFW3_9CHLO|nr:hypothetical protein Vafri_13064 [Volvox africanus]